MLRRHRREPLLELRDGRVGALGLQQQPRQQDRPAHVAGVLLEQAAQGRLGGLELLEMDLDQGFTRQEPGFSGYLARPSFSGLSDGSNWPLSTIRWRRSA